MQRAISTEYQNQECAMHAALHTVYFMAKKPLPADIFADLNGFLYLLLNLNIYLCNLTGQRVTNWLYSRRDKMTITFFKLGEPLLYF